MFYDESSMISLDELNQALEEIVNKTVDIKNDDDEELVILSTELDTAGLPVINISKLINLAMKDVITSFKSLIHLHRTILSKITDADIDHQSKNWRTAELQKIIY